MSATADRRFDQGSELGTMGSRSSRWLRILSWAACLALAGVCVGCTIPVGPTPKAQGVQASELLLNDEDLPEGWSTRVGVLDDTRHHPLAEAAVAVSFYAVGQSGVATHLIVQYRDRPEAAGAFARECATFFTSVDGGSTHWQKLDALQYKGMVADQFDYACRTGARHDGSGEAATICVAVGQYDQFISVFSTWIVPGRMSYDDLGRVLQAIDARMARRLGKTQLEDPGTAGPEP